MAKKHLKRINAPKTWKIKKKQNKFVTRVKPSGNKMGLTLPLNVLLRDIVGIAKTTREVKYILNKNNVLVNGVRRKNVKDAVGFMDVIEIKESRDIYRILLNKKEKIVPVRIEEKEKNVLLLKVKSKKIVSRGKIVFGFTNGYCLAIDNPELKIKDVVVYDVAKKSISDVIKMKEGSIALLTGGNNAGEIVKIVAIKDGIAAFQTKDNKSFETALDYAFLVGSNNPVISVEAKE